MKSALVYFKNTLAGRLSETDEGFVFQYDTAYLSSAEVQPISLTFPIQTEAFESPILFPYFDGLIPEGWLLDVALRNTDISFLDRMSLLLLCCKDCIGAVSVVPEKEEVSHV